MVFLLLTRLAPRKTLWVLPEHFQRVIALADGCVSTVCANEEYLYVQFERHKVLGYH